jgi:fatty-acyl-CoA synthase
VTQDELRDYCRADLAHFKIPRYVRFVTEYPMTVTGKVQKLQDPRAAGRRISPDRRRLVVRPN